MSPTLKWAIAAAGALLLGLAGGFGLGRAGKIEAEQALQKAKRRADEAEESGKREAEECNQRLLEARTAKQLLLSKEELLRAVVELTSNNFGLTSQHLAQARSWLRSAQKGIKAGDQPKAKALFDRIGEAQTLAMRLDPMARVQIEQILVDLQRLPGAR
jgi:hypothetical protein